MRKCPYQIGLWKSLWYVFLIGGVGGLSSHRATHPLPGGLGGIRTQAEQADGIQVGKGHSSMGSSLVSESTFLPWLPSVMDLQAIMR